jgi:PAS domain S-box-containing protein
VGARPSDLSPSTQPDGQNSNAKAEELTTLTEQNGPQRFSWHARRLDGSDVTLEVLSTPILADGQRLNVVISRDITERQTAEQKILELNQDLERRISERTAELMASEAQLRTLIEHAPEAIVVFGGETGRFISCNENATRLFGLSREQLALLTPTQVSPEFQADGRPSAVVAFEKIGEAVAGSTPVIEWIHRHADGHLIPCEVRLVRLPTEGPPVIRASIIDNTERKRTEQALRDSEEKFRALFEASSQGVILHDEYQMLEVNPACLRILGFREAAEMVGKHPEETSAPIQPNGERAGVLARKYIAECMNHGSTRFDWLARNSRGQDIPIELVLTRIQWGGRQLIQAVFNDISERKRTEAELLHTLAHEKELNQLKSNFVSMVSHEFRTPLGIIQSSAEILNDYLDRLQPAERVEQLHSIVKNTQRMSAMMEEMLVLSRLDAGKMEFAPGPVDLAVACRRLVDELLSATERRCPIELSLGALNSQADADDRLVGHIFTNLLNNAVKYSGTGQAVEFLVERAGADAVFVVSDHGIGISEEDQRWLFNAFQRGSNVGDRPGTGLGLVLVKRCVDLHRGSIQIQSALGAGTRVTVRLPVFGGVA